MLDKEKVLKGLDICSSGFCKKECPYYRQEHCSRTIMIDAYALLIEQDDNAHELQRLVNKGYEANKALLEKCNNVVAMLKEQEEKYEKAAEEGD